jgi:hypothetical protein
MINALNVRMVIIIELEVVLNFVLRIAMEYVIKIMDFVMDVKVVFIKINVMKDAIKHFAKVIANKLQANAMNAITLIIKIYPMIKDALDALIIVLNVHIF